MNTIMSVRHADSPRRLSRRGLIGATAAGLVLGTGVHASAAQSATPAASPTTGAWTFTDDAGKTVTRPAVPRRIVADLNAASALWDFGIRPLAVSGWTVTTDDAWGNVDRSTPVINAGAESGDPDLEALLELDADLFVTVVWNPADPEENYSWSFSEPGQLELAEQILPVIGISATGAADVNTARFAALAAALGADLATPELAAARAAYDAAVADFSALATEKSDLVTAFVFTGADMQNFANPEMWADLTMYQQLGLNIATPDVAAGEYWQQLSVEQVNLYPADVIMNASGSEIRDLEALQANAIYGQLPAVRAGQVGLWNQDFIMSYQGLTAALTNLTDILSTAEKVIDESASRNS